MDTTDHLPQNEGWFVWWTNDGWELDIGAFSVSKDPEKHKEWLRKERPEILIYKSGDKELTLYWEGKHRPYIQANNIPIFDGYFPFPWDQARFKK